MQKVNLLSPILLCTLSEVRKKGKVYRILGNGRANIYEKTFGMFGKCGNVFVGKKKMSIGICKIHSLFAHIKAG